VYYLASKIQTALLNIAYRLQCGRIERPDFLGNRIDSNRFVMWIESIRIANWNALLHVSCSAQPVLLTLISENFRRVNPRLRVFHRSRPNGGLNVALI